MPEDHLPQAHPGQDSLSGWCTAKCTFTHLSILGCSFFFTVSGDQPTLPELISFQSREGKVNIAEKISIQYYEFGIQLLDDKDGSYIQAIAHRHLRDAVRINTDILEEWLQGRGIQPVSWTTLVEVLEDIDLGTLAGDIREAKGLPPLPH